MLHLSVTEAGPKWGRSFLLFVINLQPYLPMSMHTITTNIPTRVAVGVIAVALGWSVWAPTAQAQTSAPATDTAAMLAQIEALMETLAILQAQLAAQQSGEVVSPEGGFTEREIAVGDRVQTTDILRVRAAASTNANWVNNVSAYTGGTVKDGPRYGDGYTWWYITYDNGTTGWSAANWLRSKGSHDAASTKANKAKEDQNNEDENGITYVERDEVCPFVWTRSMSRGDTGADVALLKKFLNSDDDTAIYYDNGFSRTYDRELEAAVKKFQAKYRAAILSPLGLVSPTGEFNQSTYAKANSLCAEYDSTNVSYDIDIDSPDNNSVFAPGDSFTLRWDQKNLDEERGIVTLEGNNTQRHIEQKVDIDDEVVRVTIPVSDELGPVTDGVYELTLRVSYIKDGDPRGVADTIKIVIASEEDDNRAELKSMIDDLIQQVRTLNGDVEAPDTERMDEDEMRAKVNSLLAQIASLESQSDAPERNAYACDRGNDEYDIGDVACYGVWDYGNSFGGDQDMCGSYNGRTGCKIEAPVCESGYAEATEYYSNRELNQMNTTNLDQLANNLRVSVSMLQAEMAGLWEYSCINGPSDPITEDFWSYDGQAAYVVGVYEGSYPDGDTHSGNHHPQGEVELVMNTQAGQFKETMLVLTSYEPVHWKLSGDATDYVTHVFLSGYYDQEISGIPDDAVVKHMSYESGDSPYFYFYNKDSSRADTLVDFIEDKLGINVYPYYGSYRAETINLGWKG